MLLSLHVRDFVLVDRIDLEFSAGFGALTGETGAGKSILVDALAFALGERADIGMIRSGQERAEVVATFAVAQSPETLAWLTENDLSADDELILRRILDAGGRSRAWINGTPATLQQIRAVADGLVDIHGQHAHQSLLRPAAQRALLDAHGGLETLCAETARAWRAWQDAERQLEAVIRDAAVLDEERARLDWQMAEIAALAAQPGEWEALEREHRRLSHAASLIENVGEALDCLSDGEASAARLTQTAASRVGDLLEVDPTLREAADLLSSAVAELDEAALVLRRYADRIELDPARLSEVEARIDALHACARRFRVAPAALPELLESVVARRAEVDASGDVAAIEARVAQLRQYYAQAAAALTARRQAVAADLARAVSAMMQDLALGGGSFDVALLPLPEGGAFGNEQVEFRLAGVAGNESRPLARVASGGELSRISLAIQVVTSRAARIPTLVFDEVDVGIGGGVAEVVGRLLTDLGGSRQVLCVTHLPQVAARADWQWQIVKERQADSVRSAVVVLDTAARIEEIARMLGGVEITPLTRRHAREMLEGALQPD